MALGAGAGAGAGEAPPKKLLIQAMKPVCAGAGATTAGGATGAGAGAARTASGLGGTTGAGASGSTPLMTGVCLLVGSCERRVTEVGSSISSAIL
ncbi:hypothetical protein D9M68_529720 [compost metagenome]